ncbi:LacI family transcriptional regulator [Sphingomonas sp. Leaf67]|uniref:LacI family DNA-binding transcriptional regulator n=1 Tax=unclassified Sphingomonas TaxID=196159 RepID=UPI0006F8A9B9|nr:MULTISPECIES: LacI family DNA-binding transcriptional regulator [unclassified Sphingomonas]KQN71892.1 LacI family transcriptional regulator [Sphingomonas sp. Leaf62]KQN91574.1 LacI family transcriptional regulator [Sphingomonas sp. Leaf67]
MEQDAQISRVRTIADLARLAGVSPGTVSRALAGKSLVNAETRDRIQALAAEHSFRPNQMASRLRTQRTGVIGVVVPLGHERRQHLSDPFFMTMLGFLADRLTEDGYDLMLSRIIPDATDWLERIVDSGMMDGVLLIGQSDQVDTIERVARRYRPLVAWGSSDLPGQVHCAVGSDNIAGGKLAGERLIARGARRIAFLGELRAPEIRQRYEGVASAMATAGIEHPPLQLDTHLASDIMVQEVTAHLDRVGGEIDGIAAASDVIALTTLRVLADRGIRVPDDMPVVGYDDLPLALSAMPRITTVRQDIARGADAMVSALFRRIAGEDAPSVMMQPVLVERDSA